MRDLLFDTPWWLLTIMGVVGIALVSAGNRRQNKNFMRGGIVVLLLGIGLATLSYLVDTPKEKVIKGTYALVNAAVARDRATIASELHPAASLAGWNRQQIIDGAVAYADQFGLKSATITGTDVHEDPTMITISIRVVARFQGQQMPYDTVPTDWQLTWWESTGGKWLLKDITPLGGGNLSGQRMAQQFFSKSP